MPVPSSPPPIPALAQPKGSPIPALAFVRRNRHVTVPLAVPPAFAVAGAAAAGTPGAVIAVPAAAAALAGTIWWAARHKWDREIERWYARLSATAAGGWLTWCAAGGLGMWVWQGATLGALSLAWGIPWYVHKRPRKQAATVIAEWARWWQYYALRWGIGGSHVIDVTTHGVIDTLHIQLLAGHQYLKHIEDILPLIESALQGHVSSRMTRAETPKGRPDQALIHLKRENPHAVEFIWDPAQAPESVSGDMPLGKDEQGAWTTARCMALNWFLIGALGGGKSNQLSVFLASLTGCRDARVWLIDRKGGKAARPWLGAVDWVATTVEEARLMLHCLLAEVRARALLGYDGNEEMTPTPEIPAIFLFIDEAHNVTSDMNGDATCQALVASITSECRSSAIRVVVSTQYGALHESVGTEQTRGNLKNRICFKVADAAHGQFALEDYAKLNPARLETPGEFYYRLDGTESSAPSRAPHIPHGLARDIAARNALIDRPPLVLYASEHQAIYDTRADRLPAQFRSSSTRAPATQEAAMWPSPAPAETPAQIAQRIEDELATIPDGPSPAGLVDPVLLEDAITHKKRLWATLLQQAPPDGVRPRDLNAGSGLSNSWTHLQLPALIRLGVITKPGDGRYMPVAGQDVWAGLERIREGHDRLADEARELVGA